MLAQCGRTRATLLAREQAVVDEYRRRLTGARNPLANDPDVWEELARQAGRLVRECAQAFDPDPPDAGDDAPGPVGGPAGDPVGDQIGTAAGLGRRGVDPQHAVRAATALFDVVLGEVQALAEGRPDAAALVAGAARTLNRRMGARLEAGALGHDTFLLDRVREAAATDRRELARELHDRLGNSIGLAMRQLEFTARAHADDPAGSRRLVEEAQQVLAGSLVELRDLIGGLRRGQADGTLKTALSAYAASFRLTEPEVLVVVNGVESWAPPETLDEVFLILRESLRNTFSHAGARQVTITVDVAPDELRAVVDDDGVGFDPGPAGEAGGCGIASMHERAEAVSGALSILSSPRGGTRVTLWAPLRGLH